MKIQELYQDIADFAGYVPGVVAGLTFKDFESRLPMVLKQTRDLVSADVLSAILTAEKDSAEGFALRAAIANQLMLSTLTFQTVNRRSSGGKDVYKYEVEQMRREYIDAYFAAIDTLFEIASSSPSYQSAWQKSRYAEILEAIPIKSCQEFTELYPIDRSFLFFFRTLAFQREAMLESEGLYKRLAELEAEDPKQIDYPQLWLLLRLATAKLVVAMALERFDIIELPKTMRNFFDEQKVSRSGQAEYQERNRLAKQLRSDAHAGILALSSALQPTSAPDAGIISATADDKIIFMP